MSDIGLERNMQMELSPLPQQNSSASIQSIEPISSQSSVEDFLNNKLEIPFKVGDRVLVSGLKEGIVRFIGQADFARGVWVGVELKKATGKNDGSVAGKRYFQCPAMHGLFAPVHKVEVCRMPVRAPPQPRSRSNLGDSSVSKSNSHNSGLTNRGSQESLSSIKSAASSTSQRMKLGVTSLTGQRTKGASHNTQTPSYYQKKLKEKEDLIKQLIKERDLSRSEFIRNAKINEAENKLVLIENKLVLQSEKERFMKNVQSEKDRYVENVQSEKDRYVENVKSKVKQLEEQVMILRENDLRIQMMEKQRTNDEIRFSLEETSFEESDTEDDVIKYLDQIDELKNKLCVAENKLKIYENGQMTSTNSCGNVESKDCCCSCVEKMAIKFASKMETLRRRAETAELDAQLLRDEQKRVKGLVHELLQVKDLTIERDLIAEIEKLKNPNQENKQESRNEENQDVGLMSIGTGASLVEKDFVESQIDSLNAKIESRLKIAESSKSMTDIDGTGQKPTTDLHDTDDCPVQNTTSSPPDASLHHGNRDEEQPYCSSCGVFGHATDQCQDEQKY